MNNVIYQVQNDLRLEEFREILINSTLGERRPVNDTERLAKMLEHANLIVTARINNKLVGVARSLTDFAFCTYLSDLAVDLGHQRSGIGKELIRQTKIHAPQAKLILLSAPAAINYYPKIGMSRHEHCYYIDNADQLK